MISLFTALPALLLIEIISGDGGHHAIRRTSRWFRDFYRDHIEGDPLTCALFLCQRLTKEFPVVASIPANGHVIRRLSSSFTDTLTYLYEQSPTKFLIVLDHLFRLLREEAESQVQNDNISTVVDDKVKVYQRTLLVWASAKGYTDVVLSLVIGGARPPAQALKVASKYGHTSTVALLLDQDAFEVDALTIASKNGHVATVNLLIERHCYQEENALKKASKNGHVDVVKVLLEHRVYRDYGLNGTALNFASAHGHAAIVSLLLDQLAAGVLEEEEEEEEEEETLYTNRFFKNLELHRVKNQALCDASEQGHTDTMRLFLDNGADVHTDTDYPLRRASRNGHKDAVELLLNRDANVRAHFNEPLYNACDGGHTAVVALLLDRGADASDEYALSAASDNSEVVALLEKKRRADALEEEKEEVSSPDGGRVAKKLRML
jgi:ankyrin repeat protein